MAKTLRTLTDPDFTTKGNTLTWAELDQTFIDIWDQTLEGAGVTATPTELNRLDGNLATVRSNIGLGSGDNVTHNNLTLTGYVDMDQISTPANPSGNIARIYNVAEGGFSTLHYVNSSGIDFEIARDSIHIVRNETGAVISKGDLVYINGANGNFPTVALADASSASTMPVFGMVVADISDNSFGEVVTEGDVSGVDTSSFNQGDTLFVDTTAGGLTTTEPTGDNIPQVVGTVIKANASGIIEVKQGTLYDLSKPNLNVSFSSIAISGQNLFPDDDPQALGTGDSPTFAGLTSNGTTTLNSQVNVNARVDIIGTSFGLGSGIRLRNTDGTSSNFELAIDSEDTLGIYDVLSSSSPIATFNFSTGAQFNKPVTIPSDTLAVGGSLTSGSTLTVAGTMDVSGNIDLSNNQFIRQSLSGGATSDVIGINAADNLVIGDANNQVDTTILRGFSSEFSAFDDVLGGYAIRYTTSNNVMKLTESAGGVAIGGSLTPGSTLTVNGDADFLGGTFNNTVTINNSTARLRYEQSGNTWDARVESNGYKIVEVGVASHFEIIPSAGDINVNLDFDHSGDYTTTGNVSIASGTLNVGGSLTSGSTLTVNGLVDIDGDLELDKGTGTVNPVLRRNGASGGIDIDTTGSSGTVSSGNSLLRILNNGAERFTLDGDGDAVIDQSLAINGSLTPGSTLTVNGPMDVAGDFDPGANFTYDMGSDTLKWRTLHAGELAVDLLTVTERKVVSGGSFLVGPGSATLESDINASVTTITVSNNGASNGDIIKFQKVGQVEWMSIDSAPTDNGDGTYDYTVTRNLDGSGANSWQSGDGFFNTGQSGGGFVDIYADTTIDGTTAGPAIDFLARNSATWNDFSVKATVGDLTNAPDLSDGTTPTGFGLFGDNVFLQGTIAAGSGNVRIGDNGINLIVGGSWGEERSIDWWTSFSATNPESSIFIDANNDIAFVRKVGGTPTVRFRVGDNEIQNLATTEFHAHAEFQSTVDFQDGIDGSTVTIADDLATQIFTINGDDNVGMLFISFASNTSGVEFAAVILLGVVSPTVLSQSSTKFEVFAKSPDLSTTNGNIGIYVDNVTQEVSIENRDGSSTTFSYLIIE